MQSCAGPVHIDISSFDSRSATEPFPQFVLTVRSLDQDALLDQGAKRFSFVQSAAKEAHGSTGGG